MNCNKCHKPNRDIARYCKWCGTPIAASAPADAGSPQNAASQPDVDPLDRLIEKEELRDELRAIVASARKKSDFCRKYGSDDRMQLSFVITGEAGTGKTTVATLLTEALHRAGIVRSPKPEVVNAVYFEDWIQELADHEKKLANSVIIFEEAHKLTGGENEKGVTLIDRALQPVMRWREKAGKPIVIFTGNPSLATYFGTHPQAKAIVNYHMQTNSLSIDGLMSIAETLLREKYHHQLAPEAAEKLRRIFVNDRRSPDDALGHAGHDAAARAYHIDLRSLGIDLVTADMVEGKEYRPKTLQEVMAEFNKYVGVEEVKQAVRTMANQIQAQVKAGDEPRPMHHYCFLGNPGTGKTTMARLFAEALNALGALPVGHLEEVSKDDLTSQYVADSSKKVMAVFKKAMGGVLFIDEAYQLANDSHGKDAIETLLKLAEDNRGKIVVILAGYTKEMGEFMKTNDGLSSRFDEVVNFRDYKPDELTEIFRRMVYGKEGLRLSPEADMQIEGFFKKMYLTRQRDFGNAREVRTTFVKAVERMTNRLQADPASPYWLTMADIEGEDASKQKSVDEILAELDDMVGMDKVKQELRKIGNHERNERRRRESGRGAVSVTDNHIAITGNPGTGKTEVARRLGQIFKALGVLPKGHVVERTRATILDSMANSAGINMNKAVDEAMGGILFIDEAYMLIPADNPSQKDKDGKEAVETLMKRMSDDAGKFIVVIAGYKAEIDEFIANANPGFSRRFAHRIHIDDYNADQLFEIFMRQAKKKAYTLTPEAQKLLRRKIEEMVTMKEKNFGNAGTILQLFNTTCRRQDDRLGQLPDEPTDEQLYTIEAVDIPYEPPRKVDVASCMAELNKLVGLGSVKKAIADMIDLITTEQERAQAKGEKPNIYMYHYRFVGNPGTGKTTVARLMGDIFYSLGLLPSNKLLEVKPADMIGGYVGQTAPKTRQVIERGLGGVLFIDEAYGLNDGQFGTNDATPELLTLLNDYRGRMVCIAAGYPREIEQWLASNTGLPRRFDATITFDDYSAPELVQIFLNVARKEGISVDEAAMQPLERYFDDLVYNKTATFGNAAEAIQYFNKVKIRQGVRLRKLGTYAREELYTLRPEDILSYHEMLQL